MGIYPPMKKFDENQLKITEMGIDLEFVGNIGNTSQRMISGLLRGLKYVQIVILRSSFLKTSVSTSPQINKAWLKLLRTSSIATQSAIKTWCLTLQKEAPCSNHWRVILLCGVTYLGHICVTYSGGSYVWHFVWFNIQLYTKHFESYVCHN